MSDDRDKFHRTLDAALARPSAAGFADALGDGTEEYAHTAEKDAQCAHWITGDRIGMPGWIPLRCRREVGHEGKHVCGSTDWNDAAGEYADDGPCLCGCRCGTCECGGPLHCVTPPGEGRPWTCPRCGSDDPAGEPPDGCPGGHVAGA